MSIEAVRASARRTTTTAALCLALGLGGLTACAEEEPAPIQAPPSAGPSSPEPRSAGSSASESTSGASDSAEQNPTEAGKSADGAGAAGDSGGAAASTSEDASATAAASSSSTPASSSSAAASEMPEQIEAAPTFIAAYRGQEQVIGGKIVPTQTNEDGVIFPEEMTVGWYGPPQWGTTPGELSSHPGVLAAHVTNRDGGKDLFYNLERLKAGDRVEISYDDGTTAVFEVDKDAVSVDKGALTGEPEHRWAWELDEPGRKVTLITCDLGSQTGFGPDVANNWVVQATRVS